MNDLGRGSTESLPVPDDVACVGESGVGATVSSAGAGQGRIGPFEEPSLEVLGIQSAGLVKAGCRSLARCFKQNEGGGHRDVQGMNHAQHGDHHLLVCKGEPLSGHAVQFGAHHDRRRSRVVDLAKVHGSLGGVGGEHGKPLSLDVRDRGADIRVPVHLYPLLRPGGRSVVQIESARRWDDMDFEHPRRIAVTQNCGEIVRLIHLVHQDREIRLPSGEGLLEPRKAFRRHGMLNAPF